MTFSHFDIYSSWHIDLVLRLCLFKVHILIIMKLFYAHIFTLLNLGETFDFVSVDFGHTTAVNDCALVLTGNKLIEKIQLEEKTDNLWGLSKHFHDLVRRLTSLSWTLKFHSAHARFIKKGILGTFEGFNCIEIFDFRKLDFHKKSRKNKQSVNSRYDHLCSQFIAFIDYST